MSPRSAHAPAARRTRRLSRHLARSLVILAVLALLTLESGLARGQSDVPLDGNDAANLTDPASATRTAPSLQTATLNGATLTLTYDAALDADSTPPGSAFTVRGIGAARSPSHVSIAGAVVTLALDAAATAAETVTLSYVKPAANPLRDVNGNDAFAFTDQAVTNNTPDLAPPLDC